MVDRITPRTTLKSRTEVSYYGILDKSPVIAEPFAQWVIEDNFSDGRPDWTGMNQPNDFMFTPDVKPFELMKLRMLNAGGSALSYFAFLMGYRDVAKAMEDPLLSAYTRAYMDEASIAVPELPFDLNDYKDSVIERFQNELGDEITRFAMDGTSKMQ